MSSDIMARQASEFTRVQRPIQEAFIRPIFQKPTGFTNLPEITYSNTGSFSDNTKTLDIRPPKGVIWKVLYASVMFVEANNTTDNLQTDIYLREGTTNLQLARGGPAVAAAPLNGEQRKITLDTNAINLISFDKYIRLSCTVAAAATAATGHMIAICQVV